MAEQARGPVLVRGVGDVGSTIAVVLFRAGYAVALHDETAPATPRRGMAFADAFFDGQAILDSLTGLHVKNATELRHALNAGDVVPITNEQSVCRGDRGNGLDARQHDAHTLASEVTTGKPNGELGTAVLFESGTTSSNPSSSSGESLANLTFGCESHR
jgi:hypothetical protein